MAGVIRSAKDLWVLISGTSLLKSKEYVGTELEDNIERIKYGGLFYKKPNSASLEKLKSQNIQGTQLEFIQKLSKVLQIDELQCYELFCSYLLYEYKGTQNNIKVIFSSERHLQSLLLEIWNFYYNERLYILLCLKHILCYCQDSSHIYKELYSGFLETINSDNSLGAKIMDQFEELLTVEPPNKDLHGQIVNEHLLYQWAALNIREQIMDQFEELLTVEPPNKDLHGQIVNEHLLYQWAALNIREQSELLQILLLYYKDASPKSEDILKLFSLFQKHSFGMRQTYRQYLGEGMKGQIDVIGYLEALVFLEMLELEWLFQCEAEGTINNFSFIKTENFNKLDEVICSFGNHPHQGPIILAWLLVRQCSGRKCKTKHLGNAALQLNVFEYLTTLLSSPILRGDGVISNLAHSIIYTLLSGLLSHFEINTLGKIQHLCQLAESMLKYSNIADDFWKKGLDSGLGILMTAVMDMFPLEFNLLIKLCTALSQAGENSSRKVIQFFEKLPGYTEYLENNMESVVPRTSSWILLEDKKPYGTDAFIIPSQTEGIMLTNIPNIASMKKVNFAYRNYPFAAVDVEIVDRLMNDLYMIKHVISNLAHSIIYTLLSGLLSHFEINTLGKIQHLCQLAESMLKYSNIADDFWKKGLDSGLGILMTAVMDMFPLEFNLLIKLCTALSQAGENSSRKVIQFFEKLPGYTEYLENNMESVVPRTSSWILLEDKKPYGTVVRWMTTINGWQICLCEIHTKLQEVSLGAGYVMQQSIQRIVDIAELTFSILESDPSSRFQLVHITNEFYVVLLRYSVLPNPSIDLLTRCLNIIRNLAKSNPEETLQRCLSINFLPYMVETSQNIPKLASGLYMNNNILGQLIVAVECVTGQYSLLLAFLKLFNEVAKVIQFFEKLPGYTEYLENNMESVVPRTSSWILLEDKKPYGTDAFIIPSQTEGIMLTNIPNIEKKGYSVVRWMTTINGWQICLCEIHTKLQEVSLGAGYVMQQSIQRIVDIAELTFSILESDPSSRFQLVHITNEFYVVLLRYSVLPNPSIDLLTRCLNIIRNLAKSNPEETLQRCLSINFLPYMVETSQNIPKLASGLYMNNNILGQLIVAVECVTGQYSLLLAFLKLFNEVAKSYQKYSEEENVFLGCLVFILQDIFPSFHKWRYVKHGVKEKIGQLCLDSFYKILLIKKNEKEKKTRIQAVCVYSLLHLAPSQALLRIVCTGEATVQQAIQAHVSGGVGQELIILVHYSLSVLNTLLFMKYKYAENENELTGISPLEHVLFSQTHHYTKPHVALIVAYYAFQHYSPCLATLAVQLLKRFAKEFPMSLLACLGTEAEAICDHYLLRLSSATEDIRLKIAIIEFLTVCISHQPGLIERFINIPVTTDKSDKERNLNSCLHSVLEILKDKQEKLVYVPEDLHCAAVEFFHALWTRHQLLAEDKLKKNDNFWTFLCNPLFHEHKHPRLIAYIIRTLALEVYNTYTFADSKLDGNVKGVLEKLVKSSLIKLSKFVHQCLNPQLAPETNHSINILDISFLSESTPDRYILLKCWKDFLLVATKFFQGDLKISENNKISIMEDILESLKFELLDTTNTKSLVLLAELYLLLLQKWNCETFPTRKKWLGFLTELIHNVAMNTDLLHPHIQLTIVCIANTSLKKMTKDSDNNELLNEFIPSWVTSVCIMLKHSTIYAEKEIIKGEMSQYMQLCTATICLLKDLNEYCQFSSNCLRNMQNYAILNTLGGILLLALEVHKGIGIIQTVLIFFLSLASNNKAAESICASGMMQELCLLITNTYTTDQDSALNVSQSISKVNLNWVDIYNLVIRLITELLQTLKHSFLQHALNFIGVHVERLYFSLQYVRQAPHSPMLEETLTTCKAIYQMSFYQQIWQLHHPISLNLLLKGISESCHVTVAYLNRPSLLMYLLEHSKVPSSKEQNMLNIADVRRYKRLSSMEEVEKLSPQFVQVQTRLLKLLAINLSIMHNISPSLYQVIFDHDLDFGKWTILLPINFSIPSIDQESQMNFGTVMNCINICLRSLTKNDPSSSSPSPSADQIHFEKTSQEERRLLLYILEISLSLLLSQAVLCLVHPNISIHDKQYIRRELGAELSSMTLTMNRYLRKSPLSPASSLVTSSQGHIQTSIFDRPLIKILGPLVDKLFK
ncbi:nucleoporin NUP188 homolog [Centruroides sculpturatus]|uniref:nucleoporin NUP188 homolog n=1 Tax=Centruroides sculpturatus TaxID=218467 RepID=UPI000C6DA5E3|nr:nucleoporin NUP188 homolog [Centruroides sculpturatus]